MIAYEAELPEGEELKPDPSEVAEFCFVPIGEALQLNLYPTYQKVLASLWENVLFREFTRVANGLWVCVMKPQLLDWPCNNLIF